MKFFYKIKLYFDIANIQVSWFFGKGPEIMSVLYILEKFDVILVKKQIIILILVAFVSFVLFGLVWKLIGFYDIEKYVGADIDPVLKELLEAARKINEGDKK